VNGGNHTVQSFTSENVLLARTTLYKYLFAMVAHLVLLREFLLRHALKAMKLHAVDSLPWNFLFFLYVVFILLIISLHTYMHIQYFVNTWKYYNNILYNENKNVNTIYM